MKYAIMLQFRCPHCEDILQIRPEHLGRAGKCNKCNGRIVLMGENDPSRIQAASVPQERPVDPNPQPATDAQRAYLHDLGTPEEELAGIDRSQASTLIQRKQSDAAENDAPTEAQLSLLARLGVKTDDLALVRNKAQASKLINDLQPKPSQHQLYYLRRLGVPEHEIGAIATRSEASERIELLLRGQD
ncbi:MAG: hypothetical protein GC168_03455 [Candidatus Hydrogenedens sp.]|nr:hypothetical protein [Candidatus Hydrogenedens sp.]